VRKQRSPRVWLVMGWLLAPAAALGAEPAVEPVARWTSGAAFQLEVAPAEPDVKPFAMHVVVLWRDQSEELNSWRLLFAAHPNAPKNLGPNHIVYVSKSSGWPRQVQLNAAGLPIQPLVSVGGLTFFDRAPRGFPVEVFPLRETNESLDNGRTAIRVAQTPEGDTTVWEATCRTEGREVRVRQRWAAGEPWWRDYERFVNGRKDLSARRTAIPKPAPSSQGKQSPKLPDPGSRVLRADSRLQALVTVLADDPGLDTVLAKLQDATGLTFAVAPNLFSHVPSLGSVQMRNAPAWSVMDLLAQTQLRGGRWERVPGGYVLHGESAAVPPRPQPVAAPPPAEFDGTARLVLAATAALLTLACGLFWVLHKRRATSGAKESTPLPQQQ
jgi:hypothetical protein